MKEPKQDFCIEVEQLCILTVWQNLHHPIAWVTLVPWTHSRRFFPLTPHKPIQNLVRATAKKPIMSPHIGVVNPSRIFSTLPPLLPLPKTKHSLTISKYRLKISSSLCFVATTMVIFSLFFFFWKYLDAMVLASYLFLRFLKLFLGSEILVFPSKIPVPYDSRSQQFDNCSH